MLGNFVKRFVNGVVLLLAGLAFFLVPVGRRTPAQHLVAIFTTQPAREAVASFGAAARRLADQVTREIERLRAAPPSGTAAPAKTPRPG